MDSINTEKERMMNKINVNDLNDLLSKEVENPTTGFKPLIKRLELMDGESLSVQTGHTHYCSPRDNYGPWMQVEVGFPSVDPSDEWKDYFDGDWESEDHTESVYGYVPIDLVVSFINDHGGIKTGEG